MSDTADRARAERLQRLQSMLDNRLRQPLAALETLMTELRAGEHHPELWEKLHAAADRDGMEIELAAAYEKVATDRRLGQLPPSARAEVLMHAANFHQGVVGDREGAARFLTRVVGVAPDHLEAFSRLERKYSTATDRLRLLELYATVAVKPPKPADELARAAINVLVLLTAGARLSDDACERLLALGSANLGLLDTLVAHCRKTDRVGLACALVERAMSERVLPEAVLLELRRRLVEMYVGNARLAPKAIAHVEEMLRRDPTDPQARTAAERLLSHREVASRAAAALHEARRRERSPGA